MKSNSPVVSMRQDLWQGRLVSNSVEAGVEVEGHLGECSVKREVSCRVYE